MYSNILTFTDPVHGVCTRRSVIEDNGSVTFTLQTHMGTDKETVSTLTVPRGGRLLEDVASTFVNLVNIERRRRHEPGLEVADPLAPEDEGGGC